MSDPVSGPAGATLSDMDLELLSLNLASIAQGIVAGHLQWVEQSRTELNRQMMESINAANMQMMQSVQMGMGGMWPGMGPNMGMPGMAPDPMSHNFEILRRFEAVAGQLGHFDEPAEILARAGKPKLQEVIGQYREGLAKGADLQREHMKAMQADNAKTQSTIAGIQNSMHETNMAAARDRYRLQVGSGNAMLEAGAKTISDRQSSFQKINDSIAKALKGDPFGS